MKQSVQLFKRFSRLLQNLMVASAITLLGMAMPALAQDNLVELIRTEQRDVAMALIEAGADVNTVHGDGSTALLWAAYHLDHELVDTLLARGARADVTNLYGASPLSEAVKAADVSLVRRLLDAGADPESANQDGQTVLMLAARTGNVEIARMLLDHGADVNAKEQWRQQTALMWAVGNRHVALTQLLIERGADVEARARVFDWGSQITSEPRAQYRPSGGLTPLLYAARTGCLACVEAILDAGAEIDRPSPDGVTPLMIAIDNYRFDTAKLLLERGANPKLWDWWGRTPLYIAVDMHSYRPGSRAALEPEEQTDAMDIIIALLEAGANPDAQLLMHRPGRGGNSGRFTDDVLTTGATPLINAANSHDLEVVKVLLQYGAQVDLPNVMGLTPLLVAAGFGAERAVLIRGKYPPGTEAKALPVVETLLAAGADIHARIQDTTSHNARIARLSSTTDRQGQNVVFAAAKQGWPDMVQLLLDNGADLFAVDEQGKTVYDAVMGNAGGRIEVPVVETLDMIKELMGIEE